MKIKTTKKPKMKAKPTPGMTRSWTDARVELFSRKALAEIDAEVERQLTLSEIREEIGQTQVTVAESLEITQGSLSKFENQSDARISTLRAYIEALGGQMAILATFADRAPVVLRLPEMSPIRSARASPRRRVAQPKSTTRAGRRSSNSRSPRAVS
jgi:hypothetical protein